MYLNGQDIETALGRAHHAFDAWSSLTIAERSAFVVRLASLIQADRKALAALITETMGKLPAEAIREVDRCVRSCESFPELAAGFLAPEHIVTEYRKSFVCYQPLGVILGITPWNFPLWQLIRFAIPAMLAGNTVLLKHAPNVFRCSQRMQQLFMDAGFPEGVFQHFPVNETGVETVIRDPRVQGVALTGSAKAGRAVARIAGESLKKVVLELGGSDPFIVRADADIDLAVNNACHARFMNAGQICVAAKRLLVHHSIARSFTDRLVQEVSKYRVGDPLDEETSLSPLARKDLCDQLERQVQESVKLGARVLKGGHRSAINECGYEATVLDNITPLMPVYREEIFGPVSSIIEFASDDEAIAIANDTAYGLGASIWTRDVEQGERMAMKLECGMVYINSLVRSDARLPFGGIKQSGFGRELGAAGFREFTNIKTVVVNH